MCPSPQCNRKRLFQLNQRRNPALRLLPAHSRSTTELLISWRMTSSRRGGIYCHRSGLRLLQSIGCVTSLGSLPAVLNLTTYLRQLNSNVQ